MTEFALQLPEDVLEAIAQRTADIVLERLGTDATPKASPLLTVRQAADYINARPQRIYDLCSGGRLTRVKDSGRTLIRRDELDRYLAGKATGPLGETLRSVAQPMPKRYRDGYGSAERR